MSDSKVNLNAGTHILSVHEQIAYAWSSMWTVWAGGWIWLWEAENMMTKCVRGKKKEVEVKQM